MAEEVDTYSKLIELLDGQKATYRLIDHEAEGQTDIVSKIRGNNLSEAAKCIIVMVKVGKKVTKYILGVVPGDRRIDLNAVKTLFGGTYVSFASQDVAEKLAGSRAGTVLPFSFDPDLQLIVDPRLLEKKEIYFNAARLDRSMALKTDDYVKAAKPRLERITEI